MSKYRNWSDSRLERAARLIQEERARRTPPLPPDSYSKWDRRLLIGLLATLVVGQIFQLLR